MNPKVQSYFDTQTCTATHIVFDAPGGHAAVIDPVLNYEPKSGRTTTRSVDEVIDFLATNKLSLQWLLETHAHADHLSGARYLQEKAGGKIAIGEKISEVQKVFKGLFNLEAEFPVDGAQFDVLFAADAKFSIGQLQAQALSVPGHTPADMAYLIGDCIFIGDTLFMPDVGTARCDFPGGDASQLFQSIQKLLSFPPETRLYLCHDYPPAGREVCTHTTVARQKAENIHVRDGVSEADFVALRKKRDSGLEMPYLLIPAIQVNIRAGALPAAEDNGTRYLKIPLNAL
ncbi:MBL fold metallo-hydrolase [Undibacterium pigrum]|uniref:Glyoxylase-like metal-dependent hydrolase (Beta-lactamase superfamily II) n=1 Tax=Undibacterium pigrum TaxID=401470 RepID=A0A318IQ76_9BURK|nr:MBL fold metallo-hydrolase [Undibacterium pigrum]PXX37294.1 glyoxylase-like metal-dependent hydrolase (beta-lactamase superfamily II) [Undibacterium pigrum]